MKNQLQSEFNALAMLYYTIQDLLEHCHRETLSGTWHAALGEAYGDFSSKKDDTLEAIIGATGEDYGEYRSAELYVFSKELCKQAAKMVMDLGKATQAFANKYGIPSVENYGQDVHAIGAKLNYKLRML
jgi:hypothetical protein